MTSTPTFAADEVFLSHEEARMVLQFFFGEGSVPSPGGITFSDRVYVSNPG